jgi:hypothetical protein
VTIIYDNSFNENEFFTIFSLLIGLILMWKLKKTFSFKEILLYFLFGVFIGIFFDHTISVPPVDYYDVNDKSSFELMDFLTYLMYGPYSYILVYFYDYFKIKIAYTPTYILLWTSVAIFMEFISKLIGIFHYKNGYNIYYSLPIYLLVYSFLICLYRFLQYKKR